MGYSTSTLVPAFLLLCYVHFGTVDSFVSFLPASTEENSAEGYNTFDDPTLENEESDDKVLYRLLYEVILDKLQNIDQGGNSDFISRPSDGSSAYKAIKRGFLGLDKMNKRKVFWQPIGFLPNKVSPANGKGNQGQSSSHNQPGQPFRYG